MDKLSLVQLLEDDREMLSANLRKDRALTAAQTVLEKEIDRITYRCLEQCKDAEQRDIAQHVLQAIKNTVPLIDAVGEAHEWKKTVQPGPARKKLRPAALSFLLAGIVLVLAAILALHIGGSGLSLTPSLLRTVLPALAGMACLFWAGIQAAKPQKPARAETEPDVRTEFLVDPDKALSVLRAALAMADRSLETLQAEAAVRRQQAQVSATGTGTLSPAAIELFSDLLEDAYARRAARDGEADEGIAAIRFFLHGEQVDIIDFEKGREGWFEFLPATRPGTIRPALVCRDRLLKKGLAAA